MLKMDLKTILSGIENSEDIIKKIQTEIGNEYVPRSEFNDKNDKLKEAEKQLGTLQTTNTALEGKKTEWETQVAELNGKIKAFETAALKSRIAHEAGLPYDLAGRLTGDTEEAIKADAEKLSALFKSAKPKEPLKDTEPQNVGGKDAAYKQLLKQIDEGD